MTTTLHAASDSSVVHGFERGGATRSQAAPGASARHLSGAAASVTFGRLVAVEARKLVDTRASRWLLIATFGIAAAGVGLNAAITPQAFPGRPLVAFDLVNTGIGSLTLLLPVMAILLAAGEFTQNGAITTFTIEPRRLRVLAAKLLAIVGAALALCAAIVPLALLAAGIVSGFGYASIDWKVNAGVLGWSVATTVLAALQGFAFGALLMNTPAAIVLYFLYPMALQLATLINERVAEVISWIHTSNAMAPLTMGEWASVHWGKVAVSIAFWVVLPLVAGSVRWLRREVK